MTLALSPLLNAARSTATRNAIDAAATPGTITVYTAPRPVDGATPAGDVLTVIALAQPCGTVDVTGLQFAPVTPAQALTAGIADWARVCDGDGNWLIDGDVRQTDATDAADAAFLIDVAQVYPGAFMALTAATLVEGG